MIIQFLHFMLKALLTISKTKFRHFCTTIKNTARMQKHFFILSRRVCNKMMNRINRVYFSFAQNFIPTQIIHTMNEKNKAYSSLLNV